MNIPIVAAFAAKLRLEDGLASLTCNAYADDVSQFSRFLGKDTNLLPEASITQLRQFVMDLMETYKVVSVRRKLYALRSFYSYLYAEGIRPDNPVLAIKFPKKGTRLPVVLREEEVNQVIETQILGRTEFHTLRDRAILELLYASGLRRAEIATLNLQNVDIESRSLRVIGKGNKERLGLFNQATADALRAYFEVRPKTKCPACFTSLWGKRLGPRQIWMIFRMFADRSGVTTHSTPHVMRHSFATHLLEGGADLLTIKELLGHKSIASTEIYTNISVQHIRKSYESAHPRDRKE